MVPAVGGTPRSARSAPLGCGCRGEWVLPGPKVILRFRAGAFADCANVRFVHQGPRAEWLIFQLAPAR